MHIAHALLAAATLAMSATPVFAQQTISVASTPQGSMSYAVATTIAKLMNEKLGFLARVQPKGGAATIAALNAGNTDFYLNNAAEARMAHFGAGIYEGRPHPNLMIAAMVFPLRVALAVPNDSKVKSIPQLKGLRMGNRFTSNTIIQVLQDALLANGGLKQSDMINRPYPNFIPAGDDMARGRLDVAFVTPGTAAVQQQHAMLQSRGGIRFLPMDRSPDALARQTAIFPESFVLTLDPAPGLPGVIGPTPVMAYPHFFTVGQHVPERIVHDVVKAMHENKDELVKGFVGFKLFDPKGMAPATRVPYHPGALAFYKDKGIAPAN